MSAACAAAAGAQPAGAAADPFAYLIPQLGAKALAWSKEQTDTTRARLEASPTLKSVLADMKAVHASAKPLPMYWLLGGHRYMRFEHDKSHPYGIIATAEADRDGRPGPWRTVFDLDAYNKTVPHPYTIKWLTPESECRAPAIDRCMIPLWYEGGQDNAYVELDIATGRVVKDGLHPCARPQRGGLDRPRYAPGRAHDRGRARCRANSRESCTYGGGERRSRGRPRYSSSSQPTRCLSSM